MSEVFPEYPVWKCRAFAYDANYANGAKRWEGLTDNEIMGLAYLNSKFNEVRVVGKSMIVGVSGFHRSGKSLFAAAVADLLDPSFQDNFEERFVYTPSEFTHLVKKIKDHHIDGACIIVDEAGTTTASDEWYEGFMKVIGKMVQKIGFLHPIIFFVAPHTTFIASKMRKMFNMFVKVKRFNNKFAVASIYELEQDDMRGKTYMKKPNIKFNDKQVKMRKMIFGIPPPEITLRYKRLSEPKKEASIDDYDKEMDTTVEKKLTINDIKDYVMRNWQPYGKTTKKGKHIIVPEAIFYDPTFEGKLTIRDAKWIKNEVEKELNKDYIEELSQAEVDEEDKKDDKEKKKRAMPDEPSASQEALDEQEEVYEK